MLLKFYKLDIAELESHGFKAIITEDNWILSTLNAFTCRNPEFCNSLEFSQNKNVEFNEKSITLFSLLF